MPLARPGQLRFGIAQGGIHRDLRAQSIEEITALPFDGFALGGLAVGESRTEMFETVGWAAELMPSDRPRYFMGLGDAEGILEVIARGIDMFDCVLPDADRAHGVGAHRRTVGSTCATRVSLAIRVRSRRAATARPACDSPAAYVRHLITQRRSSGLRLLSLHNLAFTLATDRRVRAPRSGRAPSPRTGPRPSHSSPTRPRRTLESPLIILGALFALLWVLLIRPQRSRKPASSSSLTSVEPGDEVLTVGGLYGIVHEIDEEDDLIVEIAEGIRVRIARRAVAAVVKPEDEDEVVDGEAVDEEDDVENHMEDDDIDHEDSVTATDARQPDDRRPPLT